MSDEGPAEQVDDVDPEDVAAFGAPRRIGRALLVLGALAAAIFSILWGLLPWLDARNAQIRMDATLAALSDAVGAYQACLLGDAVDGVPWGEALLVRLVAEPGLPERAGPTCYRERLRVPVEAVSELPDAEGDGSRAAAEALIETVRALSTGTLGPTVDPRRAGALCKGLVELHARLDALRVAMGRPPGGAARGQDCEVRLATRARLEHPPPPAPWIDAGAATLRRAELQGGHVVAIYAAPVSLGGSGAISRTADGVRWETVLVETLPAQVTWSGRDPWGIFPSAGGWRLRANHAGEWRDLAALPPGRSPRALVEAPSGQRWVFTSDGDRLISRAYSPGGGSAGPSVELLADGAAAARVHVAPSGAITAVTLRDRTFEAAHAEPDASPTDVRQTALPVEGVALGTRLDACSDGAHHAALAGGRWLLTSADDGQRWRRLGAFPAAAPLERTVIACFGEKVLVAGERQVAGKAALFATICTPRACPKAARVGARDAAEWAARFDATRATVLVQHYLDYAVLYEDPEARGALRPRHVFESHTIPPAGTLAIWRIEGHWYRSGAAPVPY